VAGARRGGSTGSAPSPGPGLPSAGSAENFLAAERRQASLAGWLLVGRLPFLLAGLLCPACWLSPSQALLPLFDFLALGSQPTPRCKPGGASPVRRAASIQLGYWVPIPHTRCKPWGA